MHGEIRVSGEECTGESSHFFISFLFLRGDWLSRTGEGKYVCVEGDNGRNMEESLAIARKRKIDE